MNPKLFGKKEADNFVTAKKNKARRRRGAVSGYKTRLI